MSKESRRETAFFTSVSQGKTPRNVVQYAPPETG
jgi:hypothetical protein